MKVNKYLKKNLLQVNLFCAVILLIATSSYARSTFFAAAERLLQDVEQGKVIGFVDLAGSNGEGSKLSAEIFQQIEPVLIREGIKKKLSFIERKNLKLIFFATKDILVSASNSVNPLTTSL